MDKRQIILIRAEFTLFASTDRSENASFIITMMFGFISCSGCFGSLYFSYRALSSSVEYPLGALSFRYFVVQTKLSAVPLYL